MSFLGRACRYRDLCSRFGGGDDGSRVVGDFSVAAVGHERVPSDTTKNETQCLLAAQKNQKEKARTAVNQ